MLPCRLMYVDPLYVTRSFAAYVVPLFHTPLNCIPVAPVTPVAPVMPVTPSAPVEPVEPVSPFGDSSDQYVLPAASGV